MISFKFKITLSIFIKTSKQHFDRNFCRKKKCKIASGVFYFPNIQTFKVRTFKAGGQIM